MLRVPAFVSLFLVLGCAGPRSAPTTAAPDSGAAAVKPNPNAPRKVVLTWHGYDYYNEQTVNAAVFELDGHTMGSGREGFLKVLDAMRRLPPNSTVVQVADNYQRLNALPYVSPAEALGLDSQFQQVVDERKITIEDHPTNVPGHAKPEPKPLPPVGSGRDEQNGFRLVKVLDFGARADSFYFCPSTCHAFVTFDDRGKNRLYEWDLNKKVLVNTYELGAGFTGRAVATSADGRFALVEAESARDGFLKHKALLLDTREGKVVGDFRVREIIRSAKFNRDATKLWVWDKREDVCPKRGVVYDMEGIPALCFSPQEFSWDDNPRLWVIQPGKVLLPPPGLYVRDEFAEPRRLTEYEWGDNFAMTKDGRYVAATTTSGELVAWHSTDGEQVFRKRIAEQFGGRLAYDPPRNRFLIATVNDNGTTFLHALEVPNP